MQRKKQAQEHVNMSSWHFYDVFFYDWTDLLLVSDDCDRSNHDM